VLIQAFPHDADQTTRANHALPRRQLLGIDEPIDLGYAKENPPFPEYARNRDCSTYPDVMTVSFGWYQSWATYRESDCNPVPPSALDASAYTHLAYSFGGINENFELEPYNGDFQGEEPLYSEFVGLKRKNPQLKALIAVGGWTFSDPNLPTTTRFSDMVLTAERRAIFVESTLKFLRKYGFDGVDLDWEFPATRSGSRPEDKQNYAQLVLDLRQAFDDAPEYYEITMSVPLAPSLIDPGYDLPTLSQGLDFMNLMAYDLYGIWNDVVYAHTYSPDIFGFLEYFLQLGVPPNKMVLGLASYGRTYTMEDTNCLNFGCPFVRSGPGGCLDIRSLMPYFSIQEYIANGTYQSIDVYNATTGTAIMVVENDIVITYDSPQSFSVKAQYALDSCFRGLMWWAADYLDGSLKLQVPMNPAPPTPVNPLPPTPAPVSDPTKSPTNPPTRATTRPPTRPPASSPTFMPFSRPSTAPEADPTFMPFSRPTSPGSVPTSAPIPSPVSGPTFMPFQRPTSPPSEGSRASGGLLLLLTMGIMVMMI
jgi:chitinase